MNFKSNFSGFHKQNDFFESSSLFPTSLRNRFTNDSFFSRERNFNSFFSDFDQSFANVQNSNFNENKTENNDSNVNNNVNYSPGSHFVSKSYCSSFSYNGSDEPIREVFKSESYKTVDSNGRKIAESKSAYENTAKRIQKAAHEKHLDDKAYKIVKEKELISGEEIESNYFKGLSENELNQFNSEFGIFKEQVKDDYYKRLGSDDRFAERNANANLNANRSSGDNCYLGYDKQ